MRSLNTSPDMRLLRALVFAAMLAAPANAIDPGRAMSQYLRARWGPEQGFPRGTVYAIGQSDDGYLWIGTETGLVRFDGLKFRIVRDVPGLENDNSVLGLMSDGHGNLWIRLEMYLIRYHNGAFDSPIPAASRLSAMSRSTEGPLVSVMGSGTESIRGGKMQLLVDAARLPRSPVLAVAQTTDGSLWMGTRGSGLFRSRGGQVEPVTDGLPDLKVNCLQATSDGGLWVGTDSGLAYWDGSRLAPTGPPSLRRFQILAIQPDRDGNIWAGTDSHGLLRINRQGVAFLDSPLGTPLNAVTAVFEDREGNLWTGSANGIERLRDSAFVTYSRSEGLPGAGASPVFVDEENRVWFAPASGGLYWMKDGQHGRVSNDGLDHDVVYSIAGGKGELWLGRQHGGLTRLRTQGSSFAYQTYTKAAGLAQDSVFSVYRAPDGSVWAGTLSGGVSRLSEGRFSTYTMANGLLANTVASIVQDSKGVSWFATPGGLNSLSKTRWRSYTRSEGLPSDNVYCLLEDSSGVLWIGTAAGLAFRSKAGIQTPSDEPDVLREPILGIAEDELGSLWIATSNYVLRVNRERLLQGALSTNDVRQYGTSDGLRGTGGVRRERSVVEDAAGRIWFSRAGGLSVVDPARLTRALASPIAQLQSVSVNDKLIPLTGSVHIPGGHGRLTFAYAGLGLSAPDLVRFRYRLDGYDTRWSEPTAQREAGYTNLPPRTYRFRIVASNPDGDWNGRETTLAFEVDPLFWQTWWFRIAVALAAIGAIAACFRLRMRRLTRRLKLRFEERLAERTRIAQELHDTLLQGFMSASMQVHVANDSLPAESQTRATLTRALQLMRQVIDEGRNTVRGLRSTTTALLDLETALAQIEEEGALAGSSGDRTGFRVVVEGRRRALHPMLRDEVYRIGREALLNAFRHSQAKNIEVTVQYFPNQLRILVRDDGRGIEPQILESGREGHWGLIGMRERAEQISARLHVYSRPAGGTEVDLAVPGRVAFRNYSVSTFRWFGKRHWSDVDRRESTMAKRNGK